MRKKTLTLENIIIPFSLAETKPIQNKNNNFLVIPVIFEQGTAHIFPSYEIQEQVVPDSLVEVKFGLK